MQVLNGKVRAAEQEVKKVKLEKDKKREGKEPIFVFGPRVEINVQRF